jgi:hypothetical protein
MNRLFALYLFCLILLLSSSPLHISASDNLSSGIQNQANHYLLFNGQGVEQPDLSWDHLVVRFSGDKSAESVGGVVLVHASNTAVGQSDGPFIALSGDAATTKWPIFVDTISSIGNPGIRTTANFQHAAGILYATDEKPTMSAKRNVESWFPFDIMHAGNVGTVIPARHQSQNESRKASSLDDHRVGLMNRNLQANHFLPWMERTRVALRHTTVQRSATEETLPAPVGIDFKALLIGVGLIGLVGLSNRSRQNRKGSSPIHHPIKRSCCDHEHLSQ